MNNKEVVEITDENREAILELFELETDEEGYILDQEGRRRCPYLDEEIHKSEFAILPPPRKEDERDFIVIKPERTAFILHRAEEI